MRQNKVGLGLAGGFGLLLCGAATAIIPVHTAAQQGVPAFRRNAPADGATRSLTFEQTFDTAWKTVKDNFYDKDLHGVDWRKIGQKYRAKLPAVKTKAECAELINAMLDELHASHTEFMTDDDIGFYMLPAVLSSDMREHQVAHIGVMGHYEKGEYMIAAVLDGSAAARAGLKSGDTIVSAGGQPFSTAGSFRGKEGEKVTLIVRREDEAKTVSVTVVPVKENLLAAFLKATDKSAKILDVGGKRIGYIHLWTMANDHFRQVLEKRVLEDLHGTDGLILDLRDGYGGTPFGYADPFFEPDIAWGQSGHDTPLHTRNTGYDRPMVVLTNGGTRSAKEFFTYQFKKSKRAAIVGTTTTGAFLGANGFPIGKEGYLELAVAGLRLDGKRIEGKGVAPDIEVAAQHSYTDKDAQLLRGEQSLLEAIKTAGDRPRSRDVIVP